MDTQLTTFKRNQPRTGANTDNFSEWLYKFRPEANEGFISFDIDSSIWNYRKKTFAFFEIKTRNATLSKCQAYQYPILQRMLYRGAITEGYEFKGFFILTFENTSFTDGKVFFQMVGKDVIHLITESQFKVFLITHL